MQSYLHHKRRAPFGHPEPFRKRIRASPPLPPPPSPPPIPPCWWKTRTKFVCEHASQGPAEEACYYCQKGRICAGCERCERGLCEFCVRACDECKVTSCSFCMVVDYEQRLERTLCLECCEKTGESEESEGSGDGEGGEVGDDEVMMCLE